MSHSLSRTAIAGFALVVVLSLFSRPAAAQSPVLGTPPTSPHIDVIGDASGIDLATLGPDFSAPWLAPLRDRLRPRADTPPLLRIDRRSATTDTTRVLHTYDADGRRTTTRTAVRRDTGWVPTRRTTFRYTSGRLAELHTARWTEAGWSLTRRLTIGYDQQAHPTRLQLFRRSPDSSWILATQLRIAIEADTVRITQQRRTESEWVPVAQTALTTSADGQQIIQQIAHWSGGRWMPTARTTFLYDFAGQPIEAYTAFWTGARWTDGPQHLYTHAIDGRRVVQTTETWMGTTPLNAYTTTFTYARPVDPLVIGQRRSP